MTGDCLHDHAREHSEVQRMHVIASHPGRFGLVAAEVQLAEASQSALARRRTFLRNSQAICEDLAENVGWLQHPDDPDRVGEVVSLVRRRAAELQLLVGRLPIPWDSAYPVLEEVSALIDAVDAEVRLAIIGKRGARARARHLSALLRASAATLACEGAA
jgi:hypothetical protein